MIELISFDDIRQYSDPQYQQVLSETDNKNIQQFLIDYKNQIYQLIFKYRQFVKSESKYRMYDFNSPELKVPELRFLDRNPYISFHCYCYSNETLIWEVRRFKYNEYTKIKEYLDCVLNDQHST